MNYKQIKERNQEYEKLCVDWSNKMLKHIPGIYIYARITEDCKMAMYIGQAKDVLNRAVSHLQGYKTKNATHIDKSLKKHGLFNKSNIAGWYVYDVIYCKEEDLNRLERETIEKWKGEAILLNVTSGGQDKGKTDINERNNAKLKTYKNGLENGYNKALKEFKTYFEKYLDATIKGNTNKIKEKKLMEFKNKMGA